MKRDCHGCNNSGVEGWPRNNACRALPPATAYSEVLAGAARRFPKALIPSVLSGFVKVILRKP